MTLLSRRSLFAVAAVVDVALLAGPVPVAAKALASRHGVGPRHLEPVLHGLVRAGILKGVRGPRGGYELARERRRISVGDIVRALSREGPDDGNPSGLVAAAIAPALEEVEAAFLAGLDRITVQDLCVRAGRAGIETGTLDFTI